MSHHIRSLLASAVSLSAVALLATTSPATAASSAAASPHEVNGGYREKLHLAGAI